MKQKFIRQKTLHNKWLSSTLLQDIKLKNRLFAKKLKHPTESNINLYHNQLKKVLGSCQKSNVYLNLNLLQLGR